MGTRENFRENLKAYRKQRNLTQERLSELIGYGETYITEIESRHKFPKPETIDAIARALEIEPYQLFQKQNQEKQKEKVAALGEKLYESICNDLRKQIFQKVMEEFDF